MGAAPLHESTATEDACADVGAPDARGDGLALAPAAVEVRRHAGVAAGVGLVASAVAIAYLARATATGAPVDWALALGMGALAAGWLVALVDGRTPLLVADVHGVRLRLGRTWRGLPWSAVHHVEHRPRRGLLRDGRLVVVPHNLERFEADLDRAGRRRTALSRRVLGAPLAVPLGLTTSVAGAEGDLTTALRRVADQDSEVVELGPDQVRGPVLDPRPVLARLIAGLGARRSAGPATPDEAPDEVDASVAEDAVPTAGGASVPPSPAREASSARRAEVHREVAAGAEAPLPSDDADPTGDTGEEDSPSRRPLRSPGRVTLVEDTQVWGERVRPIARAGDAVAPLVIDEFEVEPAEDPVVGPEVAAARTRLGLSVDQLADRTRIRPHVIESIEVDDFTPCGGDFYARGHLRTLARVLGIDVAPLLTAYDERYANAPVNARRVFEAELATGATGSIRSTRGGPNWSVLVAVVMALVLCWSVARLVMDTPADLRSSAPVLNGSGGPDGSAAAPAADPVEVVVAAPAGGAHVVVRDGEGEIVFKGNLAVGDARQMTASPPVRVQSSDGAVTVSLAGGQARAVGDAGVAGQGTFVTG